MTHYDVYGSGADDIHGDVRYHGRDDARGDVRCRTRDGVHGYARGGAHVHGRDDVHSADDRAQYGSLQGLHPHPCHKHRF